MSSIRGVSEQVRDETTESRISLASTSAAQAAGLESLLSHLEDSRLFLHDLEGRIIFWSSGCEHIFGFSKTAALGRLLEDLFHPVFPIPREEIEQQVLSSGFWQGEVSYRRQDQSVIAVTSQWALQRDDQGLPAAFAQEVTILNLPDLSERDSYSRLPLTEITELVSAPNWLGWFTAASIQFARRRELERAEKDIAFLERQRISRDLHDDVGQELTSLGLFADTLAETLKSELPSHAALAHRIREGVKRSLRKVRAVARGLTADVAHGAQLPQALQELVGRLGECSKVECEFISHSQEPLLNAIQATQLYRIAQEACTNAIKHANASRLTLTIQAKDGDFLLRIQDDGDGISNATQGLGRQNMRDRAQAIGAQLTIEAARPTGTLVSCSLEKAKISA